MCGYYVGMFVVVDKEKNKQISRKLILILWSVWTVVHVFVHIIEHNRRRALWVVQRTHVHVVRACATTPPVKSVKRKATTGKRRKLLSVNIFTRCWFTFYALYPSPSTTDLRYNADLRNCGCLHV